MESKISGLAPGDGPRCLKKLGKEISQFGDPAKLSAQDVQDFIQKKSMRALGLNGNGKQKVVPLNDVKSWGYSWMGVRFHSPRKLGDRQTVRILIAY